MYTWKIANRFTSYLSLKKSPVSPLPTIRDGNVSPAICTAGDVSFGTICQMECHQGYSLVGPSRKQCTPEGMWAPSVDGEMNRCEGNDIKETFDIFL